MELEFVLAALGAIGLCAVALAPFILAVRKGSPQRLWLLGVVAGCGFAIVSNSAFDVFVHVPSFLLVSAGVFAALAVRDAGTMRQALVGGWMGHPMSGADRRQADFALSTLRGACRVMALIGFFIGLIGALNAADDPKAIGPFMAGMLLTPFYAAFLGGVVLSTVRSCVRAEAMNEGREESRERPSGGWIQWVFFVQLAGLFLVMAIVVDNSLSWFVNLPSMMLTGSGFLLTFAAYGVGRSSEAIRDGLAGAGASPREEAGSREILNDLRWSFHLMSGIALIIGLIHMVSNLDDPNAIGPALGVALLAPLYGVVAGEFVVGTLERRLRPGEWGLAVEDGEDKAESGSFEGGTIDV